MIHCNRCGAALRSGSAYCGACGAQAPANAAGASVPTAGWQPLAERARHVTLTLCRKCTHCANPVPINGPTLVLHCDDCQRQTEISATALAEELSLAAQGSQRLGSSYSADRYEGPDPTCTKCGAKVNIGSYVHHFGAVTTIACPQCRAELPTYPAPAWLRGELPTAVQVFGGAPSVAQHEAGLSLAVDQATVEPVVMACPKCGGGLTITVDAERTLRCEYCSANVFLPDELWRRLHPVTTMARWTLTYTRTLTGAAELRHREHQETERRRANAVAAERRRKDAAMHARSVAKLTPVKAIVWALAIGACLLWLYWTAGNGVVGSTALPDEVLIRWKPELQPYIVGVLMVLSFIPAIVAAWGTSMEQRVGFGRSASRLVGVFFLALAPFAGAVFGLIFVVELARGKQPFSGWATGDQYRRDIVQTLRIGSFRWPMMLLYLVMTLCWQMSFMHWTAILA